MNTLRLEAGYRHWGHDITDEDTPIEAGLSFAVDFEKPGGFIGRDALLAQSGTPAPSGWFSSNSTIPTTCCITMNRSGATTRSWGGPVQGCSATWPSQPWQWGISATPMVLAVTISSPAHSRSKWRENAFRPQPSSVLSTRPKPGSRCSQPDDLICTTPAQAIAVSIVAVVVDHGTSIGLIVARAAELASRAVARL